MSNGARGARDWDEGGISIYGSPHDVMGSGKPFDNIRSDHSIVGKYVMDWATDVDIMAIDASTAGT